MYSFEPTNLWHILFLRILWKISKFGVSIVDKFHRKWCSVADNPWGELLEFVSINKHFSKPKEFSKTIIQTWVSTHIFSSPKLDKYYKSFPYNTHTHTHTHKHILFCNMLAKIFSFFFLPVFYKAFKEW